MCFLRFFSSRWIRFWYGWSYSYRPGHSNKHWLDKNIFHSTSTISRLRGECIIVRSIICITIWSTSFLIRLVHLFALWSRKELMFISLLRPPLLSPVWFFCLFLSCITSGPCCSFSSSLVSLSVCRRPTSIFIWFTCGVEKSLLSCKVR